MTATSGAPSARRNRPVHIPSVSIAARKIIDELASLAAKKYLAKEANFADTMWALVAATKKSDVPNEIARRMATSRRCLPSDVPDLSEKLMAALVDRLIPGPGGTAKVQLDFQRLADGKSWSSWLRSYGTPTALTVLRTMHRSRKVNGHPGLSPVEHADPRSAVTPMTTARAEQALDLLHARTRRAGPDEALWAKAEVLGDFYSVPPVRRPETAAGRQAILEALGTPGHLSDVVTALAADRPTTSPIADLFVDFDSDTFASLPREAVELLVQAAAVPRPPTPRTTYRLVRAWAAEQTPREHRSLVRTMMDAWAAASTDVVKEGEQIVPKPDDDRHRDAMAFMEAAYWVLEKGVFVFGVTTDEIRATLTATEGRLAREANESRLDDAAARRTHAG